MLISQYDHIIVFVVDVILVIYVTYIDIYIYIQIKKNGFKKRGREEGNKRK